jgi:ribonuclease HIII
MSALLDFLERTIHRAAEAGFRLEDEREIPYGLQCVFTQGEQRISVNLYHSAKKGCSAVVLGPPKHPLRPKFQAIFGQVSTPQIRIHPWTHWIGSDESGKGDFFGPLVVGGFRMEPTIEKEAIAFGLRDSKQMDDADIDRIVPLLWKKFPNHVAVMILSPHRYNDLYERFRAEGKKLNQLLAWMHAKVIGKLLENHTPEGILVDKFASPAVIRAPLGNIGPVALKVETKAEIDPAVAAGSMIARHYFRYEMDLMSRKFGITFPKGAGHNVDAIGREFLRRFPREQLHDVAKLHFANLGKIG